MTTVEPEHIAYVCVQASIHFSRVLVILSLVFPDAFRNLINVLLEREGRRIQLP